MKSIIRKAAEGVALAALGLGALACATTHQTRKVETSGFLGDYSQLREGKGEEALLVYVDEKADFKKYRKIMLDPIAIYADEKSLFGGVSQEDQQALVNYFDATIREKLGPDYEFVDKAGPDTLRMRVAITEAKGAKVLMNVVSSFTPIGLGLSSLKKIATGTHTAVASTSAEMELLDSATGKRLMAGVDERAGRKFGGPKAKLSQWEQVRDAFDFWAARMQTRLAELRGDPPPAR